MSGNDQVRHCSLCRLNVYNVADMSEADAMDLIRSNEHRLCMRLSRRADGTLITKDCPVGVVTVRRRLAYAFAMAGAVLITGLASAFTIRNREERTPFRERCEIAKDELLMREPFATWFPQPEVLLGSVAMPLPSPTPTSSTQP